MDPDHESMPEGSELSSLFTTLYDELYKVAISRCAGLRPGHTLHPTAVIHEAYMRLEKSTFSMRSRGQFLSLAATAMKSVILDYVKHKSAQKRTPPGGHVVQMDEWVAGFEENVGDLITFDESLARLQAADAQAAKVVELRFFGGMEYKEISEALGLNEKEVSKHFAFARAWLARELP